MVVLAAFSARQHCARDACRRPMQRITGGGRCHQAREAQDTGGTWSFCVDYRYLNALTVRGQYPIPIFE
jgi:hypothetical protein